MTPPSVSIILPVFNRLIYLRPAIDSVFAQTVVDWELIIADDGSDEETKDYLRTLETSARVKLIQLPHSGNPGAARNVALHAAQGRYLAFLDSDDIWLPTKLQSQLDAHEACPGRRWSYTALNRIDANGQVVPELPNNRRVPFDGFIFEQLLTLNAVVATPCVMAERQLVEQAGGFDEKQLFFEEYDLWLHLSLMSAVIAIEQPLVLVRSHLQHYSVDRVGVYKARLQLLDKVACHAATPRLAAVLRSERAQTAASLALVVAAAGYRVRALNMLWRSRAGAWRQRNWWRTARTTILLAVSPSWLRVAVRWYRQQQRLRSV